MSEKESHCKVKEQLKTSYVLQIIFTVTVIIYFANICYAYHDTRNAFSPDKKHNVIWECEKDFQISDIYTQSCKIYVIDSSRNKVWINKESSLPEPIVKWHNNDLAEIKIPCGSPCNYSIFYETSKGVSIPFEFVLAVDADRQIIARVDASGIIVNSIYGKPDISISRIDRDFSDTAALVFVIEDVHFTKKGNLFIRYLSGKNYQPKEEVILIKHKHN